MPDLNWGIGYVRPARHGFMVVDIRISEEDAKAEVLEAHESGRAMSGPGHGREANGSTTEQPVAV